MSKYRIPPSLMSGSMSLFLDTVIKPAIAAGLNDTTRTDVWLNEAHQWGWMWIRTRIKQRAHLRYHAATDQRDDLE